MTQTIKKLGLLLAVAIMAGFYWMRGVKLFVIQSGSMAPAVTVGSLVAVKPAREYLPGELITFVSRAVVADRERGVVVTHRLIDSHGNEYLTKGDANDALDGETVRRDKVLGKVILVVPGLGYGVNFVKTPVGFGLVIALPLGLIIGHELTVIIREVRRLLNKGVKGRAVRGFYQLRKVTPLLVLGCVGLTVVTAGSLARLSDQEKIEGNTLRAAEWSAPAAAGEPAAGGAAQAVKEPVAEEVKEEAEMASESGEASGSATGF